MTTTTRYPLEALIRLPSFYFPVPSDDGRRVAYYSDRTGRLELFVQNIETGEIQQISRGDLPRSSALPVVWDHAGNSLALVKDVGGNEQHDIWIVDVATGESRQITDTPNVQEIPLEFSPDDTRLSFLSTRDGQLNLYSIRRDGSDVTALTHFANPVFSGGQWSPDGRWLIANANESQDLHNSDVYVVPAGGGEPRKVFSSREGAQDEASDWSPDGRLLAVTSDASGVRRAGTLAVETGEVRWFGEEGIIVTAVAFSADGRLLLAVRNRDAAILPVVYDLETGAERLPALPAGGSLPSDWEVGFALGGRALVMRFSTDATRPALLLYDLEASDCRTLLEPEYGPIDPAAFVMAEDVYYPSFDGLTIHALLYRPHDIPDGTRLPAVVMPHGGPTWQYSHGFVAIFQFLASEGYVVLAPNVRGSTGYSVEFRDMARMDWGGADLQDIVHGRDYVAALPFVDPDRIGVAGGSYGGFMTFIAMTKAPDAWKAGVGLVGMSDLPALYAESMPHFKYYLEEQLGDPAENVELWRDRSATNFADRMIGKLLIVHGVNDPRCPISQARLLRERLLAAGKEEGRDFEYVELGEEGHGSLDQDQRLREYQLMTDFLARSL